MIANVEAELLDQYDSQQTSLFTAGIVGKEERRKSIKR